VIYTFVFLSQAEPGRAGGTRAEPGQKLGRTQVERGHNPGGQATAWHAADLPLAGLRISLNCVQNLQFPDVHVFRISGFVDMREMFPGTF